MVIFLRKDCSLTIAWTIALCTAWKISLPCKPICWPWGDGTIHRACVSTLGSVRLCRHKEGRALCSFTPYADRPVHSVVEEDKYLGVLISDGLSCPPHISSVTGKAASTLAFLRRNLRQYPVQLKERAYIAFVRSTLDYASAIWDPFLKVALTTWRK